MMNDEQGSPDRLAQGPGSADLTGGRDRGGDAGGYRGAYAAGTGSRCPAGRGRRRGRSARRLPDAPAGARRAPLGRARKRSRSTWRELPILIIVALAIALVIKTFVVQPFFIPSSSMEDTLLIGDKVLVNKLVYHFRSVQPGDIIVFNGVGSWNPAPPATKPSSNPFVRALRRDAEAAVPLDRRAVRHADRPDRLHQARHRRAGRRRRVLQRAGPGDGQRRPAARVVLPVSGRCAVGDPLQQGGPAGRLWVMGDNRQFRTTRGCGSLIPAAARSPSARSSAGPS